MRFKCLSRLRHHHDQVDAAARSYPLRHLERHVISWRGFAYGIVVHLHALHRLHQVRRVAHDVDIRPLADGQLQVNRGHSGVCVLVGHFASQNLRHRNTSYDRLEAA
jgi:hypothetical protein